jgi:hypothetical protein
MLMISWHRHPELHRTVLLPAVRRMLHVALPGATSA